MTTGTRLRKAKSKIIPLLLSTTIWTVAGTSFGWYVGSQGGFKRGVNLVADLVIQLHDIDLRPAPRKYTDI
jgi:hypothetical protein